jgi:hypothetical protein
VTATCNGQDGYPQYRRRDDGRRVEKNGFLFDNRHVVPFLSHFFNCHINVEIATSIASVKYLHKYVHQGHDRATISLESDDAQPTDEPKDFVNSRCVSCMEAMWRTFRFLLHQRYPAVTRLRLHLQDMEHVMFGVVESASEELLRRT